jgi:hypothetical protein
MIARVCYSIAAIVAIHLAELAALVAFAIAITNRVHERGRRQGFHVGWEAGQAHLLKIVRAMVPDAGPPAGSPDHGRRGD